MMPGNGYVRKAMLSVWANFLLLVSCYYSFSTPERPYELAVYDVLAMYG